LKAFIVESLFLLRIVSGEIGGSLNYFSDSLSALSFS